MEQTSATAYPNVLVLEYLRRTGQVGSKKEATKKAEEMVALGYQQLVRFQRPNGGFNWWGNEQPTNDVLTALGLQEFWHMAQVREVDERIIDRAKRYLYERQRPDGSWQATTELHGYNMQLGSSDLVASAYITWSLLEAGEKGAPVQKALEYLRKNLGTASEDPYILALVANALALGDAKHPATQRALNELALRRSADPKRPGAAFIPSQVKTVTYSTGEAATVETTALAASAFLVAGTNAPLASELLQYLLASKQADGSFGSTQATILALRALILSAGGKKQEGRAEVSLVLNGKEAGQTTLTPDDHDVTRMFDLMPLTRVGMNRLEVRVRGQTAAQLQVVARHYRRWPPKAGPKETPLVLDLRYDRQKARVGQAIKARAEVRYRGDAPTFMVTAELGLPPGMTLDASALDGLVRKNQIASWRVHQGKLVVFFNDVQPDSRHVFEYQLVPRMPLKAQSPESVVYEYYTPSNRAVANPVPLEVT